MIQNVNVDYKYKIMNDNSSYMHFYGVVPKLIAFIKYKSDLFKGRREVYLTLVEDIRDEDSVVFFFQKSQKDVEEMVIDKIYQEIADEMEDNMNMINKKIKLDFIESNIKDYNKVSWRWSKRLFKYEKNLNQKG